MYIHMFIQLFKFWHWGPVHTEPEDFKNAVFTPKTHQFFLVYTTPKEFRKTIYTQRWFSNWVWGKFSQGYYMITWRYRFRNGSVLKMFPVHIKTNVFENCQFHLKKIITTLTVLCLRLYEVATLLLLCFLLSVFNNNSCYIYSLTSQIPGIKSWVIRFWTYHSVHKFYGTLHSKDVRSSCQLPSPLCMPSRPLGPDRLKIKPPPE